MRRFLTGASLALLLAQGAPAHAALLDPKFTQTDFAKLQTMLTGMAWAPDGSDRLFLIRHTGEVRIVENGVVLTTPFATIAPIYKTDECGLLGMAFDPGFIENHYIYFYVSITDSQQQIVRYTANGNVGENPTVIIPDIPASGTNHCGGGLGFGADGKLYFSVGDFGKSIGVDDDATTMAGKVNRANSDGTVPVDNPFVDGPGPNDDFIWAKGFRNPYSLTRNPSTDRIWVNVVGTLYEQIFTPIAGDNAGWDNYENNQPAGFITPIIAYRTGGFDNRVIANATRAGGVATFTTTVAHRFRVGTKVTISGVANPSFNGTAFVNAIPTTTEFSIQQAGANASSTGGSAITLTIGNAITGGTFWDSSGVPADYRGNFFFGDYISDNMVRAKIDASGNVTEVDFWGDYPLPIDFDVGPDGNLYYISYGNVTIGGAIAKASYDFTSQGLVVSRLHVRGPEGGSAAFNVRLAMSPSAGVTVAVANATGDADISVSTGAQLTFDATNWAKPQLVQLAAAEDADSVDDEATIAVSSAGLTTENVTARVTDDDGVAIVATPASVTLGEGESGTFDVSLTNPPSSDVSVSVTHTSGDADLGITSATVLLFDSTNWSTPQTVTLAAAEDADAIDDAHELTLEAAGLDPRSVAVTVADDEAPPDAGSGGTPAGGTGGIGGYAGSSGSGGTKSNPSSDDDDDGGCGCAVLEQSHFSPWFGLGALLLVLRRARPGGRRGIRRHRR